MTVPYLLLFPSDFQNKSIKYSNLVVVNDNKMFHISIFPKMFFFSRSKLRIEDIKEANKALQVRDPVSQTD